MQQFPISTEIGHFRKNCTFLQIRPILVSRPQEDAGSIRYAPGQGVSFLPGRRPVGVVPGSSQLDRGNGGGRVTGSRGVDLIFTKFWAILLFVTTNLYYGTDSYDVSTFLLRKSPISGEVQKRHFCVFSPLK